MLPRRSPPGDAVLETKVVEAQRLAEHPRPVRRATNDPNPLEEALAEAFRQGSFALSDLDAVRELVRSGAAFLRDKEHLVDAARSWLHAAAVLRKANTPVTFATLAWQMTTHGSARASEALDARDHALNREAQQELQSLGAHAPREPVRVPTRR
jgi:hypothetical protein